MWAARSGILDVVSLLCKKGGNPNLYDSQGYNALHLAAHGAHYFMILYLVACQGMDLDSLDSMGRTSLMVGLCGFAGFWSSLESTLLTGIVVGTASGSPTWDSRRTA